MNLEISIPSKTFLLGEYSVLKTGRALVATTEQRFCLKVSLNQYSETLGIHKESPAGKLISFNKDTLNQLKIEFVDPYLSAGGMGASTAQFALVYAAIELIQGKSLAFLAKVESATAMWREYQKFVWNGEGEAPSGADILSQWVGGVVLVDSGKSIYQKMRWPFTGETFLIVRTGSKLATHEHLRELQINEGLLDLTQIFERALEAFQSSNLDRWSEMVTDYGATLKKMGLEADRTTNLLEQLKSHSIYGVKGCGAMGVDTLILHCNRDNLNDVLKRVKGCGLEVLATADDLATDGLRVDSFESTEGCQR